MTTDTKRRACVIGWPIEHSRSPLIHGYWLSKYHIDGAYDRRPVRPEEAAAFLRTLGQQGLVGCNVTVPHKEVAFRIADERDKSAVAVGAANTIWLEGGRVCCANTDTYGYMTHLGLRAPHWRKHDRPASILGAGGAARAIVYGFLAAGVGKVRVFNRTLARAEELARHFGPAVEAVDWNQRSVLSREAGVLVNTTTIGMKGEGTLDIDFTGFNPDCVVSDIVYVPLETGLMAAARERGLTVVDGLGMLLHQAVPGFERWFGIRPEVTEELTALLIDDVSRAS